MGYQMVTRPMTSRDPRRCCEAYRYPSDSLASCLVTWRTISYSTISYSIRLSNTYVIQADRTLESRTPLMVDNNCSCMAVMVSGW